jgi:hypothetical protein
LHQNRFPDHSLCYIDDSSFIVVPIVIVADLSARGSGSGLDLANAVYNDRLEVAIIEKDQMGGTCLNRGYVLSNLLIDSA